MALLRFGCLLLTQDPENSRDDRLFLYVQEERLKNLAEAWAEGDKISPEEMKFLEEIKSGRYNT